MNLFDPRLPDRFWGKVSVPIGTGCWLWTASRDHGGYARIKCSERTALAHRWSYTALVGPIPRGLEMDHLCRTRHCVNPDHVEPVTRRVNVLRGLNPCSLHAKKTHCPAGHPLTGDNLRVDARGSRNCLACRRDRAPSLSPANPVPKRVLSLVTAGVSSARDIRLAVGISQGYTSQILRLLERAGMVARENHRKWVPTGGSLDG